MVDKKPSSFNTFSQSPLWDIKKYLKKWLGVPSRGCTNLSIFHPYLLSIKPVSQIYLQGHVGNFINSTLKADSAVKHAINSSIYREKQWTRKSSTIVQCDQILDKLSETEHIPAPGNCPNVAVSTRIEVPKLKSKTTVPRLKSQTPNSKSKVHKHTLPN